MSPRTRQSLISFRVRKNVQRESKRIQEDDLSQNSSQSEDDTPLSTLRTPRSLKPPLSCLTPASALATLRLDSPANKTPGCSAQKALHVESNELPCRENELKILEDFLTDCSTNYKTASMYISGLPGTGKTAALTKVMESNKISSEYMTIFVNCTAVKSSSAIYQRIAEALKAKPTSKSEKAAITAINRVITFKKGSRKQKLILLVLDEIDQLESKFQSVLYTIFEWPSKTNSRVVLIGIANAIDLTDRMLPRLQMLPMKPILLHFQPYTKEEITVILKHRLSQATDSAFFAPGSLELISAKVAGQSGDLRRALDLGRRVLECAKARTPGTAENTPNSRKQLFPTEKTPTKNSPAKRKLDTFPVPDNHRLLNLRATPRKNLVARLDASPAISPRKRTHEATDDNEILNKTPRKALLKDAEISKENIINTRRTPRKSVVPESPKIVERSPGDKKDGGALNKTPRKALLQESEISKENVSTRKTPRKSVFLESPKTVEPSTCGKKDLLQDAETSKENVITRRTPRKSIIPESPVERSPCKELFPFQSPAKTAALLASPRRSPRKQLFVDSLASPLKSSPRKHLFSDVASLRMSPRKVSVQASDVMSVVSQMYKSATSLSEDSAFPLHQKLLLSTLLLILTKGKNKDVTIGKLHEVYGRVCSRRGISGVDQSAFISLCRQVEMRGGVDIGKGPGRLAKINLQWDEAEMAHALKDTSLLSAILADTTVLAKK